MFHIQALIIAASIHVSIMCPHPNEDLTSKAAYKSGDIADQSSPITLEKIKNRLQESGIFDFEDPSLNDMERKELSKLLDTIEIMTTSRNRQPSSAQSIFSSLRLVERVLKKQVKEGQVSESLAAKFKWDKISYRQRREDKPLYYLDKTTNMRVFNTYI